MKMQRRMMWMASPFFMGFFIFYILPFASSLYYSFIESAFSQRFVGFDNYIAVWGNKYYQLALNNTFQFMAIGVPALLILSLIIALALHSLGGRHAVLRSAFILPILLPTASVIPLVGQLLTNPSSTVYLTLKSMGLSNDQLVQFPVYLLFIWKNVGFNVVLLMAALAMIPKDIYEAAALDGAYGLRRFWRITLPLILNVLFFVTVLSMVYSLRIFKEAYLLYGAYPSSAIYLVQHYMNNHFTKLNYQHLTAGAIMFALFIYLLVALSYEFERRMDVTL